MVVSARDLLQTKLAIPPVRTELVPRPRLTEQFNQGLSRPLTLICAPAGYGKTTLLGEWFASGGGKGIAVAWLSLDEDDNDPTRFLTYLIFALTSISGIDRGETLSLLDSPQPPPTKVILTMLMSRLEALLDHFALVLDDYHLITAKPIHEALTFLLDHLPAQMSLVITSREDPPLPLARLRGRGQLAEIRADDLRFTPEEAEQFLGQMLSIRLSAEQIGDMDARTEGWIAGLQLAALAMRGREDIADFISAFTGSHRFILDYLTEEVLNRQPEDLRSFLLQTSILNRMNGALCDAVTGRTDGQQILERIERGNLFLFSLDDERYWYRYHHLFRDMLRRYLQRTTPNLVMELHRRASLWLEQNGWVVEAVEQALWGQDAKKAAWLVEKYGERVWMRGELATVLRWLEALPETALKAHPKLELDYAYLLTMTDVYDDAEKHVLEVERTLLDEAMAVDEDERHRLLGQAAAIRATVSLLKNYPGDVIIAAGHMALAQLPESDLNWRAWAGAMVGIAHYLSNGEMNEAERCLKEAVRLCEITNDTFTMMIGLSQLSRLYMIQGRLRLAVATSEQLLQRGMTPRSRGQARIDRGYVRYEQNDLKGAEEDVTEARRIFEGYELKRFSIDGCVTMARLKWVQGNKVEAQSLMRQAVEIVQGGDLKQTFVAEAVWQVWLWLKLGDVFVAAEWARGIEPTAQDDLNPALEFEHITLARVQMAQGRLDEAEALLARLFLAADSAGRMGRAIVICALRALVISMQGDTERAVDMLRYALALAEPEGYVRTFVDEGAPMAALLREAKARGIAAAYVTQLLNAFDHDTPSNPSALAEQNGGGDIEALSERELEVLRLIADGASNREIADTLVVSIGTVKKHLNNIFLKLDAHSRTQALAAARNWGLL